jgi:deoxyribonuclease V
VDLDPVKRLRWPEDKEKVRALEELIRKRIRIEPLKTPATTVAGVDAAFFDDKIICAACLYEYPGLIPVKEVHVVRVARFPYIPGLLSFREGPAVIEAVEKLAVKPGVIITSGVGASQPVVQCDMKMPKKQLVECLAPNRRVEIEVTAMSK